MSHSTIFGMSESGKTTLARKLCALAKKAGRNVLVFDPFLTQWDCHYITSDINKLNRVVMDNKNCDVFIDEAGKALQRDDAAFQHLATLSRHFGHRMFFICQFPTMITPGIRSNCAAIYCFRVSGEQADFLAKESGHDCLREAITLRQGEYIAIMGSFQTPQKLRVF